MALDGKSGGATASVIAPPGCRKSDGGFSTVEVIAGLLILSAALVPLMDVFLSLRQNGAGIAANAARMAAFDNALDIVETINVGETPEGKKAFGGWSVRWQAELVGEDTQFRQVCRDIGLYDTTLTVYYRGPDGSQGAASYDLRMVGWIDQHTDPSSLSQREIIDACHSGDQ